jgi:hypothetical protein
MLRRVAVIGSSVVVLVALIYLVARPSGLDARERALLDRADEAATAAGCGDVQDIDAYQGAPDGGHIGVNVPEAPPLSSYPSQPPTSGPHDQSPLPAGIYPTPPPVYRTIHSLEHAAVVIWHRPNAPEGQVQRLADFFRGDDRIEKVIVAPYDYSSTDGEAGVLPAGTNIALVAWHRMRTCQRISLPVAFQFVEDFRNGGEAPEPGAGI